MVEVVIKHFSRVAKLECPGSSEVAPQYYPRDDHLSYANISSKSGDRMERSWNVDEGSTK